MSGTEYMYILLSFLAAFAVFGIALNIILDNEESQTATPINRPHDIEAKISEEVEKQYGKNTAWYYLGDIVEENSADILVNKNGCLIYRTVVLFDPSLASKEPRKQQKQRQKKHQKLQKKQKLKQQM